MVSAIGVPHQGGEPRCVVDVRLPCRAQIELIVEELGIGSVEPRARGDEAVLKASSGF